MEFYGFPFTWEFHFIPSDELHHFSEGWRKTTNVYIYIYTDIYCIWFKSTISIYGIYGPLIWLIVIDK